MVNVSRVRGVRYLGAALVCATMLAQAGAADAAKCTQKGTGGVDVLKGTNKKDVLCGKGGDDVMIGKGGNDVLKGAAGNDTLTAKGGNDTVSGGAGDDTVSGGPGNDTLKGGGGTDVSGFSDLPSAIQVDLAAGTVDGDGHDKISTVENIVGTAFDDRIDGDAGPNELSGGEGNDMIVGRQGDDVLKGQDGRDSTTYAAVANPVVANLRSGTVSGDGNDAISGIENLTGSAYDDVIEGDTGDNTLDAGPGRDTLSFAGAPAGVVADIGDGGVDADGDDSVQGFEDLIGSAHDDRLVGGPGANSISGGPGADVLIGLGGNDHLDGQDGVDKAAYAYSSTPIVADLRARTVTGEGNDTLDSVENVTGSPQSDTFAGDAGNNVFDGAEGADTISFAASPALVIADLGSGVSTGDGSDTLLGIENALGSTHADSIIGSDISNSIAGGPGADTLVGDEGNDHIFGEDGDDGLYGGNDDDEISGAAGDDHLDGGVGVNDCDGGSGNNSFAGNCDGDPPALPAFSLSPSSVDTSGTSRTIDFTLTATDASAGVDPVASQVIVHAPAGSPTFSDDLQLTSGDKVNGTYSASIQLPRYSAQGFWTVDVKLADQAGNEITLTSAQLQSAGLAYRFQQTGAGDTAAPILGAGTFVTSPTAIDTAGASRVVNFDFDATDDLAGVDLSASSVTVTGPTGASFQSTLQLVGGSPVNGSFHAQVTIPQYSAPGTWTVELLLVDGASNQVLLEPAQLSGNFTQTGNGDTTAPTLSAFTASPLLINTAEVDQVVDITLDATDDLSGVDPASSKVVAIDPINQPRGESPLIHTTGNSYTASITVPQGSATGSWKLQVELVDAVGNVRVITSSQLIAAGFPGTFQNVAPTGT